MSVREFVHRTSALDTDVTIIQEMLMPNRNFFAKGCGGQLACIPFDVITG
jgi:hypothetical protein